LIFQIHSFARSSGKVSSSFGQLNAYLGSAWGPIDLDFVAGASERLDGTATSVSGLQAVDKYTVKIELKAPYAAFLALMAIERPVRGSRPLRGARVLVSNWPNPVICTLPPLRSSAGSRSRRSR
jgi:ABC-type transport system substrate-binding protein